jgi:hypothetical protein
MLGWLYWETSCRCPFNPSYQILSPTLQPLLFKMPYATQIPWLLQKALTTLRTTPTDGDFTNGDDTVVRQDNVLDIKLMMEQRLQQDLRGVPIEMKAYFVEVWIHDYFCMRLSQASDEG